MFCCPLHVCQSRHNHAQRIASDSQRFVVAAPTGRLLSLCPLAFPSCTHSLHFQYRPVTLMIWFLLFFFCFVHPTDNNAVFADGAGGNLENNSNKKRGVFKKWITNPVRKLSQSKVDKAFQGPTAAAASTTTKTSSVGTATTTTTTTTTTTVVAAAPEAPPPTHTSLSKVIY